VPLTLLTPPAEEPVSLAEAKLHLRMDFAESKALERLKISKIPGRFAQHDFECADYVYELKSRSNRLECFADTVISADKFEGLAKPLVLVFSFTDCLCYIEYSEKKFENYKKSLFGRLDRSSSEAKIHVLVPVGDLVKIREWLVNI
jgi:hypothetical protein